MHFRLPVFLVILIAALAEPAWAVKDQAKITLVQLTVRDKSPDSVIERMPAFFEQAAEYGSDLIVFPEYVLGQRITIEHPRVQKFFKLAKKHNMYALAGMAEIILWINGRQGMIEDGYCRFAADAYGCVVGANITDGKNTGFAGRYVRAPGPREESRLFPRIAEPGDACVHATIDLKALRRGRKHLRTMHQRRPELYGRLTEDVKIWQDYPDVPWDYPECDGLVNQAQLPAPEK